MEVEHYPKWKETIGGTDFPLPWLWEEEWDLKASQTFLQNCKTRNIRRTLHLQYVVVVAAQFQSL